MILIISNPQGDGHVASVTTELSRRGEEFRIYNPAGYPAESTVTVDSTPGGVRTSLRWDGADLDLDDVKSVWYRRPDEFELSDRLTTEEKEWTRSECNHLFQSVWSGMRSYWVSEPRAIRNASAKVMQLDVAAGMGFTVPRFTVTNDVDSAAGFISSCRGGAIVKVLAYPFIAYPERGCRLYTHLLTVEDLEHIESVRFGPTFLQEFVEKEMDVRVTVFGEEVFAVGIKSAGFEEARIDFRRAEIYDLPHCVLDLPKGLSSLCVELVRRLGLRFGAIDLILTPDGRYFFLEINPNGQWYWLELMTGVPLTRSLCDLLTGASNVERSMSPR
ncbi:MvdC/MvdD family ATP grasp protein [Streptomyces sp. NPDC051211]|uniref:MvdC/MvdD family ATP grasp protein n=1 Tax=Streptomyces sp. NPDC051211 TaxID=3154643 RepID=UPI00345036CD